MAAGASGSTPSLASSSACLSWNSASSAAALLAGSTAVGAVAGKGDTDMWGEGCCGDPESRLAAGSEGTATVSYVLLLQPKGSCLPTSEDCNKTLQ